MRRLLSLGSRLSVILLLAAFGSESTGRAAAQEETPRPHKSAYGKLEVIDGHSVIMRSEEGQRLAWRFDPAVVAEIARFELGHPLIVIYRQTQPNEKRVTAVAFPGATTVPRYRNMTGERIVFRSGPKVDGSCGAGGGKQVRESTIPDLGQVETSEACWCCAPAGETCTTGNESGVGQAFLVTCFK